MALVQACLICGTSGTSADVAMALVRWREPIGGRVFDAIPRCKDHESCRLRVETLGDRWEVWDPGEPEPRPERVPPPAPPVVEVVEAAAPPSDPMPEEPVEWFQL